MLVAAKHLLIPFCMCRHRAPVLELGVCKFVPIAAVRQPLGSVPDLQLQLPVRVEAEEVQVVLASADQGRLGGERATLVVPPVPLMSVPELVFVRWLLSAVDAQEVDAVGTPMGDLGGGGEVAAQVFPALVLAAVPEEVVEVAAVPGYGPDVEAFGVHGRGYWCAGEVIST